jgi:hypothetical protein
MAFPIGWPPRAASGRRSIRFYRTGTATVNYDGNAFLFYDDIGANVVAPLPYVAPGSVTPVHVGGVAFDTAASPPVYGSGSPSGTGQNAKDAAPREHANAPYTSEAAPKPQIWANTIVVRNKGAGALFISFDGTNDHGRLLAGEVREFRQRYEAGIAIKGDGATPDFEIEAW